LLSISAVSGQGVLRQQEEESPAEREDGRGGITLL